MPKTCSDPRYFINMMFTDQGIVYFKPDGSPVDEYFDRSLLERPVLRSEFDIKREHNDNLES